MAQAARKSDRTSGSCSVGLICCPHSRNGMIQDVSDNVLINRMGAFREGDTGSCNCPHGGSFKGTSGSGTVFINGKPASRIGDSTACMSCGQSGSVISGSPNVNIGG